jgi:GTA TIM-barrel-like domain/Putative phage tail protein
MATIVLGLAGAALGGNLFGGVFGAVVGRAIGAFAGSLIDKAIVNALTPGSEQTGPRLTTTDISSASEGGVIDRVFGRARTSGQMIWATRFEEVVTTERTGGKGFNFTPEVTTTTFSYLGNFACGFCEGPVSGLGRIWADGKEVDQSKIEFRFYTGGETQLPDPLILAKETNAPAYRGLCYIVFEQFPLADYGNRFPQIQAEIFRATGDLETIIPGVAVIGGNEFGFDTQLVETTGGTAAFTTKAPNNKNQLLAAADFTASMDRMKMLMPGCNSVMLVLPWFGDDLRAGSCTIRPKVDNGAKVTAPHLWAVSGLTRGAALVVTQISGAPAFGGSPSDASVIRCIQDLNARGLNVTLLPFMMMDIPSTNTLPNPYSNNAAGAGQSAFPWRGSVTGSPAAGFAGTVDKTAAAATQVNAFVGTAAPGDFSAAGTTITYAGPAEWSYRRFILHYAKLAALAGGVDAFLIGSEMIGLTQLRSSASAFPFVDKLKLIAADVRTILGAGPKIGYAADWSEYHSHRPSDGTNDIYFNLDPLWSDANVDFVGIDNYFPIADWRDGSAHLDFNAALGPTTIYDQAYLKAQIESGEYYDYFYASNAARLAQTRSVISDGAYAKPWTFRQKDLKNWWLNAHKNRPAGTESASATSWAAQGKPIRFIEMGCPAVDKGANQPNVFVDAKSVESAYPHFSNHARDDAMQRAYLTATISYWNDPAKNPNSIVYGGRMIDMPNSHVWCWDARVWPDFPLTGAWGDAANWETGHWLTGRIGAAPALETIRAILGDVGFTQYQIEAIPFSVDGITSGSLGSPRTMLEALRPAFQFDCIESDGVIKFQSRLGRAPVKALAENDLALAEGSSARYRITRAQETELPGAVKLRFGDPARDDQPASVEARRSAGGSLRVSDMSPPVIMAENIAAAIAERELHGAWMARERASFILPPRHLALDPGDVVTLTPAGMQLKIADIGDGGGRSIEAVRVDPLTFGPVALAISAGKKQAAQASMNAVVFFVDGPLLQDTDIDHAAYIGGAVLPFDHGIAIYRSPTSSGYELDTVLTIPAILGETTAPFYSGPLYYWDLVSTLSVTMARGSLSSATDDLVLNGANAMLIENSGGEWELIQFANAAATGVQSWNLTRLLRGQKGTEHAMGNPVPAGARVLFINSALRQSGLPAALAGVTLNWRSGPATADIGSSGFVTQSVTLRGKARRPYAPVQLSRTFIGADIALAWIRRTRIGGDSWEPEEVPLGETSELYDVEVMNGAGTLIMRTISSLPSPSFLYTSAMQVSDFGANQSALRWRVYQKSSTFGRGIMAELNG